MFRLVRRAAIACVLIACAPMTSEAQAPEPPLLAEAVAAGELPPIAERLPETPRVTDPAAIGRAVGQYGGTLRTLVSRRKDARQMVVWGYARLMGYGPDYSLEPDVLQDVDIHEGRRYTLRLRPGHRWSDGAPLTSEDFRYWWEDVANHPALSPTGPPVSLRSGGAFPTVTFPDAHTVVYEWPTPNPRFLPLLAQASPLFLYRPAHYMNQFHGDYAAADSLADLVADANARSWSRLHNKRDNLYKNDNPDLPNLQPWVRSGLSTSTRLIFHRNPYFHRVDAAGAQLPYIDRVEMTVASGGLVAAKTNAGESDLQSRGLSFSDISVLKRGERVGGYDTYLWSNGYASQIAIFPNLNYVDPAWRMVFRDARFRRALSLAIDRRIINRSLYFGLASASGVSALPASPLYDAETAGAWARYDVDAANALLDEMGFTQRRGDGVRRRPDGTPLEIIVKIPGDRREVADALTLVGEDWRRIGVKLILRPLSVDILRDQVYSGRAMMSVWYGWNNGLPTPDTAPDYVAPCFQEEFCWPKWGQHHQTGGEAGEAPDLPAAVRLMDMAESWTRAADTGERAQIWREMLALHADSVFAIGLVNQTPQPVVVSNRLRNVPPEGVWAWDPGAHFGVHRMDLFFIDKGGR